MLQCVDVISGTKFSLCVKHVVKPARGLLFQTFILSTNISHCPLHIF